MGDMINNILSDAAYYATNGKHMEAIKEEVRMEIQKQYEALEHGAKGRYIYSIFAHSLGSVICYDLIAEGKLYKFMEKGIDQLFLVGSPLPFFLATRDDMKPAAVSKKQL